MGGPGTERKLIWYLKQVFPCLYYTTYERDGKKYFTMWRMWFGKVFSDVEFGV
jgi:hypothetical protein